MEPKSKKSPLDHLKDDVDFYQESLLEVAQEIINSKVSEHPIFIAHQHEVSVGEVILDRMELGTGWTVQASTLEEFVEKGIILKEKEPQFKATYKNPLQHMCIFVIVPEGANFVFYPYKKD